MTRPAATTPLPSQTMGTTGPDVMYLRRLGKKGLDTRSL
jgi:hypothetical protein